MVDMNKKWLDGIIINNNIAEIIVVDNGSCAKWHEELMRHEDDRVKIIKQKESLSYSQACNAGALIATSDTLCFLNSDVEINSEQWHVPFLQALDKDNVGIVGASGRRLLPETWYGGAVQYDNDVDYAEGWCVWIKRDILNCVNGWDEEYTPFYCEDSDLSFKIKYLLGKTIEIIPQHEQKIKHIGGATIKINYNIQIERNRLAVNTIKFRNKWDALFVPMMGFVDRKVVAVLIPSHVDEKYLIQCLDSVKHEPGIMIYVALDKMEFDKQADYPNIKFYHVDYGNVNKTRNYLVSITQEPYIYFLDADNYLKPGTVTKLKHSMILNNADVVYCQAEILKESTDDWFHNETNGLLNTYDYNPELLRERNYIDMGSLIRRAALPPDCPFDEELKALHDWDLWLRLTEQKKIFYYLKEPLYVYRIHNNNLSKDGKQWAESITRLRNKHGNDIGVNIKKIKISLVTIAKTQSEIDNKIRELKSQTIVPDEYCTSTHPDLVAAWVEAFSKVTGDIVVVTETDTSVTSNKFIEELIDNLKENEIVKGNEINHRWENFANIAFRLSILKDNPITKDYSYAQDTEWYVRCKNKGIKVRQVNGATVIHDRGIVSQKQLDRAYEYGRIHARLILNTNFYSISELMNRYELQKAIAEESLRGMRDELEKEKRN
jgi:GT2 family glycosyltransferase